MEQRRYVADDEIDLRELFLSLWHRRWVIAGITVAAGVLAAAVSLYVLPPVYESRTYIQLSEHSSPAYATPHAAAGRCRWREVAKWRAWEIGARFRATSTDEDKGGS